MGEKNKGTGRSTHTSYNAWLWIAVLSFQNVVVLI